jgi:hypothetical protein
MLIPRLLELWGICSQKLLREVYTSARTQESNLADLLGVKILKPWEPRPSIYALSPEKLNTGAQRDFSLACSLPQNAGENLNVHPQRRG